MQSGMDDPETIRTHAYEFAFSSTDEMFHSTMYDWLIDRGLADELLEVGLPVCSHIEISPQIVPDASSLHRGAPQTRTRQCPEMSTTMAVLCQGRTTSPGSRSAWCSSRIHGVSCDAVWVGKQRWCTSCSIDLSLDARLEYLTLAVGNAKSHPISVGGRHETAIAFLTDLEEKLDVAQVQLEVYNALVPHLNDPGEAGEKVRILSKTLLTMSEVCASLLWLQDELIRPPSCTNYMRNHLTSQLWNYSFCMSPNIAMRTLFGQYGTKHLKTVSLFIVSLYFF